MSSEPFHKLIPCCENAGGIRKKLREDGSGKYAYIVLYTSMEELEWPDYLDEETGIFRYYGDNRQPGRELTDTKKKGNLILETTFALLNEGTHLDDMHSKKTMQEIQILLRNTFSYLMKRKGSGMRRKWLVNTKRIRIFL